MKEASVSGVTKVGYVEVWRSDTREIVACGDAFGWKEHYFLGYVEVMMWEYDKYYFLFNGGGYVEDVGHTTDDA